MHRGMNKKDFFVSYNKDDKAWAKWIAGTLEENGYTVYLQAWDIVPGDDFIDQMNRFLEYSSNYIPIVSKNFLDSVYCKKELSTAFNECLNGAIDKFLPIRIENVLLGPIYKTTVYIDLFDIVESDAKKALLNGIGLTENPRIKSEFPGKSPNNKKSETEKATVDKIEFPGVIKVPPIRKSPLMGKTKIRDIIILEKDKNKKGDLFNRLVFDVFHALGFGEPHYNIQKSGREIDMVLRHRTEERFAIVESKARNDKIGGNDINKFVGALDVEKGKYETNGSSVIGYFISKSGFTESALMQEEERKKKQAHRNELVLLGPNEIVQELIQGNMLCSLENAVKQSPSKELELCESVDLIAHEQGWTWVLYYSTHPRQAATHYALVHADGNLLLKSVSDTLAEKAKSLTTPFSQLTYLDSTIDSAVNNQKTQDAYFRYLEDELGDIQFEGMPTDKDAGAVKVNLENIFVPLMFNRSDLNEADDEFKKGQVKIKDILEKSSKSAILAKPGGGKSTLIRRIALAYAFPERRVQVDDGLPDRNWFPIYIRCRDLGDDATKSVLEIIATIVNRAEITSFSREFDKLVENSLQEGTALLLIDGLDEISNENYRVRFVNQLRTFVATYPSIHLIITSRIAGFRAVSGAIANYCEKYSIADFNKEQISLLSVKWHYAVLGEAGQPEEESWKVCDIIFNDPRIIALAENPLLLTTLLFVKRWVGYLPTKKCQLYAEMIKLLLVTWNAVAHDRLDVDETEPQLAYVAYSMTLQGRQTITKEALEKCINEARVSLPELLSYTKVSASTFINQVEERSSLLIQVGLEENERGNLVPSYEFSHLSFQEYLTAKAVAEGWVPVLFDSSPLDILKPHINEEHWKEVIPLAAVLIGRQAKEVVEYLVSLSNEALENEKTMDDENVESQLAPFHLANCIASEVPMSQELFENAIKTVVKSRKIIDRLRGPDNNIRTRDIYETILKSKYSDIFQEIIKKTTFDRQYGNNLSEFIVAWSDIHEILHGYEISLSSVLDLLSSEDCEAQVTGALMMMQFAFQHNKKAGRENDSLETGIDNTKIIEAIYFSISKLLNTDDELCVFAAAWCIGWSGYEELNIVPKALVPCIAKRLAELWTSGQLSSGLMRMVSWGLFSICTPDLHNTMLQDIPELESTAKDKIRKQENDFDLVAAMNIVVLMEYMEADQVNALISESNHRHLRANKRSGTRFIKSKGYNVKEIIDAKNVQQKNARSNKRRGSKA